MTKVKLSIEDTNTTKFEIFRILMLHIEDWSQDATQVKV